MYNNASKAYAQYDSLCRDGERQNFIFLSLKIDDFFLPGLV